MLSQQALIWTTVVAAVCGLFSFGLARAIVRTVWRRAASSTWPTVPGEVIQSEIDAPQARASDDRNDCGVRIRYRYQVDGKSFESDCVRPGLVGMTRRVFAEELVARYPLGAHVDVTYNPKAPEDASLEPTNADSVLPYVVFLIVFASVGAVLTAHAIAGKVLMTAGGLPMFAFLLPVAAILVGIFCVVAFGHMRRIARESVGWPAARGKITASTVTRETVTVEREKDVSRLETRYRPVVNYTYRVGAHDYFGSGINGPWTMMSDTPEAAQAVVAAHPLGREVAVYYDPMRPRTAVLQRGNAAGSFVPLVAGSVFTFGGVLMLWAFASI